MSPQLCASPSPTSHGSEESKQGMSRNLNKSPTMSTTNSPTSNLLTPWPKHWPNKSATHIYFRLGFYLQLCFRNCQIKSALLRDHDFYLSLNKGRALASPIHWFSSWLHCDWLFAGFHNNDIFVDSKTTILIFVILVSWITDFPLKSVSSDANHETTEGKSQFPFQRCWTDWSHIKWLVVSASKGSSTPQDSMSTV